MDDRHDGAGGSGPRASSRRRFIHRRRFGGAGRRCWPARPAPTRGSSAPTTGSRSARSAAATAVRLREMLKGTAGTFDSNFDLRSVCDIWSVNREKGASHARSSSASDPRLTGTRGDARGQGAGRVMVATGDHQHGAHPGRGGAAARTPTARSPWPTRWRTQARSRRGGESGSIAQMGSQWLSCPYQQRVREIVRSGRWPDHQDRAELELQRAAVASPPRPDIAAIRERTPTGSAGCWPPLAPLRPPRLLRVPDLQGLLRGITDQWYSHGSGLAHFYLDAFIPDDTVASGGIFAWHRRAENPDTFQCLSTFREERCSTATAPPTATATETTR